MELHFRRLEPRRAFLTFGALLLAVAASPLLREPPDRLLHRATSPVDLVVEEMGAQWRFLREAADVIPSGVSYTIVADTPDDEMNLFMMSLGLLPGRKAVPRTYWGSPVARPWQHVDYVIDFECRFGSPRFETVRTLAGGCVRKRR